MRILPHQQNTGAFFVAVLEKTSALNMKEKLSKAGDADTEKPTDSTNDAAETKNKRLCDESLPPLQRKRLKKSVFKEDPFVFFKEDEVVWPEIKDFYKISDAFDSTCLLTRCHVGKKKNIYLTSPALRDLVIQNQAAIKFINTGVKTFVRSDNRNMKCAFRYVENLVR